jgi:hypothetical protein
MNEFDTKQGRRERKLREKQGLMPKHGQNLAKVYTDAIIKRLKRRGK